MVGRLLAPHSAQGSAPAKALPWWMWILAAIAIFVLSQLSVLVTPQGGSVAAWWPAAGVSVLFILWTPRRQWCAFVLMVALVTGAANAVAGRPLAVSLCFGISNAIETGVFTLLLHYRLRHRLVLDRVSGAWRFALATIAASSVLGVLVGTVLAQSASDAALLGAHAAVSHAAAILLLAPFAILPPHIGQPTPAGEIVAQILVLTGILVVLATVGSGLPLTFLPVGIIAWAAFRFPIRAAYTETLIASVIVLALTVLGLGPFAGAGLTPEVSALLTILFIFMVASASIFMSTASYQLRTAIRSARSTTELVTSGVVDSRVGILIVAHEGDAWRVLLSNTASRTIAGSEIDADRRWRAGPLLRATAESLREGHLVTHSTPDGRVISVDASRITGLAERVSVQFLDVTENARAVEVRIAAEQDRARALAAQLDLERRQVDFIATASHELRTPITSVTGYLELVEEAGELPAQSREWLAVASRNAHRLQELIEDLLIAARDKRAHTAYLDVEVIRVGDLITDALKPFDDIARARGLTVTVSAHAGTVRGSRQQLTRALRSLISNAVKFTPTHGTIQILAEEEAIAASPDAKTPLAGVRIVVSDDGPGIEAKDLPHVFERFYRTAHAEATNTAGSGLGLSIAKDLAEANGGRVEISSTVGQGVIASLVLPSEPADAASGPVDRALRSAGTPPA